MHVTIDLYAAEMSDLLIDIKESIDNKIFGLYM